MQQPGLALLALATWAALRPSAGKWGACFQASSGRGVPPSIERLPAIWSRHFCLQLGIASDLQEIGIFLINSRSPRMFRKEPHVNRRVSDLLTW